MLLLGTAAVAQGRTVCPIKECRTQIRQLTQKMALKNDKAFTDAEMAAALGLILPTEVAAREAAGFNRMPDYTGFDSASPEELLAAPVRGPRSYDGDLLNLLSLVSDDCAERAWRLMGISLVDGKQRRKEFLQRIGPLLRNGP